MKKNITFWLLGLVLCKSAIAFAANNDLSTISKGLNTFTFNLYQKTSQSQQNMIVSPYSVAEPLGVLSLGALGDTRTQILSTLHLAAGAQHIPEEFTGLHRVINYKKPCGYDVMCLINAAWQAITVGKPLTINNALWTQQGMSLQPAFMEQVKKFPNISSNSIDFNSDPTAAATTINNWVAKQTSGKIQQLVSAPPINKQTNLIITNAIFFKDSWQHRFKKEDTQLHAFTLSDGHKIKVPMMWQQASFDYMENSLLQMVELPYQNSKLAMVIVVPKKGHNLNEIKNYLNASMFTQLLAKTQQTKLAIQLPKFTILSGYQLKDALSALGMSTLFTDKANLSGITSAPLSVGNIIQKAGIAVDEKGTVAFSATAIMIFAGAPLYKEFIADHPFVFLIYDKQTKVILFIGQVLNPVEG